MERVMDRAECATGASCAIWGFGVQSVQLARLVLWRVFLVMNRSSVRFRQAAQIEALIRTFSNSPVGLSGGLPCRRAEDVVQAAP